MQYIWNKNCMQVFLIYILANKIASRKINMIYKKKLIVFLQVIFSFGNPTLIPSETIENQTDMPTI